MGVSKDRVRPDEDPLSGDGELGTDRAKYRPLVLFVGMNEHLRDRKRESVAVRLGSLPLTA